MPRKADGPEPAVRGEDGHGDAVERVADFGDVLGVSLFLGGEQVLLEARPVRQGMQGVGRPRDGGDVFVDFLFAFRREESLAEPRAIGGELLAQIDARDAVAGVFAAQDEHLLVHERGEADRGLIERGHQFPHVRSPGFHHVDLAAHHGAELHHLERHRKKPRLVVLADIAELDEAVEEAVHRALLQRQGLAYLKGLVRAVGAEEFQNVENFL